MIEGIDISFYQATTPSLAGRSFVFVKASEGLAMDTRYSMHAANVKSVGVVLGAYHFARNDVATPEAQARTFIAAAAGASLYALDVEGVHAFSNAQIGAFMAEMHRQGKTCGLYHSASGFPTAGQDWNWVAQWGTKPPTIPWAFWQYQGSPLDLDEFNGDLAALHALAAKGEPMLKRKAEGWTANATGADYFDSPGGTKLGTLPPGSALSSGGETLDGLWRIIAISGTAGVNPQWVYVARASLTPMVPGGDPAFDAAVQALLLSRKVPTADPLALAAAKLAGAQAEWDRQNANATAKVALAPRPA